MLALPAATALGGRRDVRLTILAPPALHPVFEAVPGALLSPVDPRVNRPLRAWSVGRALRGDDDVAILLPTSFSSALVARLAGVPRRVGRAGDGRAALLTDVLPRRRLPRGPIRGPVTYDPAFHRWRDYAELVEHVTGGPVDERYPVRVSAAAARAAAPLLQEPRGGGPLVGLNPGANARSRRWPAARFVALGAALRRDADARIVVLGGSPEAALSAHIAVAVPGAASFAGRTTLRTLLAVLARLDLLVTNDTGPMHLAAALGTPLLDLCGAADERVTAPRGPRAHVVRELLWCSPCVRSVCPFDLECMQALTVERVAAEAASALAAGRAA